MKPVLLGVPQGSVLGPLLFLLYNDDSANDHGTHITLYADDILLYRVIHNPSDYIFWRMASMSNWVPKNKLTLNLSKCKFLVLSGNPT